MSADIFIYILPYLTSRLLIIASIISRRTLQSSSIIGGEPQAGNNQSEFRRFFFSLHKFLFSFFSVTQQPKRYPKWVTPYTRYILIYKEV